MTTSTGIDLAAARTGLREWFAGLVGLTTTQVQWADEPRTAVSGVCGLLQVIAIRELGRVEHQHAFDGTAPAGSELVRKVGGPRVLTLSLTLDGYDQRLPEGVFFRLEAARTRIAGEDSLAALRALGLALVRTERIQNVPRLDDGRVYPRAVLDVELGYTAVEALEPTTWIETVELTTHVSDVDGVELPAPPNQTVTLTAP